MAEEVTELPLQVFTTAASLLEMLDQSLMLTLRDERVVYGILRSFDTFGNVVLHNTVERIFFPDGTYAETPRGLWIIRGENIQIIGEVEDDDASTELLQSLKQIDFEQAEARLATEKSYRDEHYKEAREISLRAGLDPSYPSHVFQLSK